MNYENLFKAYKFFFKLLCRLQFIVNSSTVHKEMYRIYAN